MKHITKAWALALALLLFAAAGNAQTIHAILAGATNVSDIGPGCQSSIKLMENALKYVGEQTDMKVKFTYCIGNDFNRDNIERAINNISPKSDDVIFFYSTSHGFNYNNNVSKYTFIGAHPTKIEMTRSELHEFGMSLEKEIFEPLQMKGARLTLALSEACNTVVDIPAPTRYHAMNVNIPKRLKELFVEAKGSAISSSSRLDQRSWTDPKDGGIYTNMFISAMNDVISNDGTATWEEVFNRTEQYTSDYANNEGIRGGQRPQTDTYFHDTPIKVVEEKTKKSSRIRGAYYAPKLKVIEEQN